MKIKFVLIACLISLHTFSQEKIVFGVKAGVNLSGFHTGNGTNSDLVGFHLGGIAKMNLNKTFGLQTELNVNSKGGIYKLPMAPYSPTVKLTYLNVPVILQTHISKKFNFEFGPELGFLVNQKAELNGQSIEINDVSSFDLNLNAGLSYEFKNGILIQSRYGYGLSKLFDESDYKNSCISLSLGYFFK
jgi:hypothetical protein